MGPSSIVLEPKRTNRPHLEELRSGRGERLGDSSCRVRLLADDKRVTAWCGGLGEISQQRRSLIAMFLRRAAWLPVRDLRAHLLQVRLRNLLGIRSEVPQRHPKAVGIQVQEVRREALARKLQGRGREEIGRA